VVLFALDANGMFTLSEGRALESLGLVPGQVVGRSAYEIYRGVPAVLDNIRRALAGEEFTAVVDLGKFAFETRYTPVRDAEGRVTGLIGVATDVTERRRSRSSCASRRRWRRSAGWRAAWRTTSTTCWPRSRATPS
jgi:PAS domain-containing protein